MSSGHFPGHALPELWVLTDASGFTTSCHPSHEALANEASRVPLLAPITVFRWATGRAINDHHPPRNRAVHTLKDVFQWP